MVVSTLKSKQEILSTKTSLGLQDKNIFDKLNCYFKLSIKGWLLLSLGSLLLKLTPIFLTVPISAIAIAVVIRAFLFVFGYGQTLAISSTATVNQSESDRQSVAPLKTPNFLKREPKIVAIGGGTGLSNLLRGLKQYSSNLTAIVTVADDGGSSGRLRAEMGVLPPGDIRNCIVALAKEESLLTELFQYRFQAGEGLKGHSFGNLFLTAMSEITGDLEQAVIACSQVLGVQGQILPATLSDVNLWAELDTGELIVGESKITEAKGRIDRIGCLPANPPALPAAIKAIEKADCIVIGPGSLYTSIIPNLLVPEIREAIAKAKVPKIYVCNIMTQPGETDGYSVSDHIRAIDKVSGLKLFDTVLVNRQIPSFESLLKYAQEDSHPVVFDREQISNLERRVILADVLQENRQTNQIRHDFQQLAKEIMQQIATPKRASKTQRIEKYS